MIAWTEGRSVVLELRAGLEARIPRSRVEHAIEVLTLGRVSSRRRVAETFGVDLPRQLLEASEATRREACDLIRKQAATIEASRKERKRWDRWTQQWTE